MKQTFKNGGYVHANQHGIENVNASHLSIKTKKDKVLFASYLAKVESIIGTVKFQWFDQTNGADELDLTINGEIDKGCHEYTDITYLWGGYGVSLYLSTCRRPGETTTYVIGTECTGENDEPEMIVRFEKLEEITDGVFGEAVGVFKARYQERTILTLGKVHTFDDEKTKIDISQSSFDEAQQVREKMASMIGSEHTETGFIDRGGGITEFHYTWKFGDRNEFPHVCTYLMLLISVKDDADSRYELVVVEALPIGNDFYCAGMFTAPTERDIERAIHHHKLAETKAEKIKLQRTEDKMKFEKTISDTNEHPDM